MTENIFTDQKLKHLKALVEAVKQESEMQIMKWGVQARTSFEWLTYTTEELGSLAKAIGEWEYSLGSPERVRAEAIQVATLCLKIAEMFEDA